MAVAESTVATPTGRLTAQPLKPLDLVSLSLIVIGALNWGLVGAFGVDLVATLFGTMSALSRIVYVLVGLAALYSIWMATRLRTRP